MTPTDPESNREITLSRPLVGVIAIVCLLAAVGLKLGFSGDDRAELWITGFGRSGLLMAALWIALPRRGPFVLSRSTALGVLLAIFAVSARPSIILRLLPVFAVLGAIAHFLKRRPTSRDDRPDRSSWK